MTSKSSPNKFHEIDSSNPTTIQMFAGPLSRVVKIVFKMRERQTCVIDTAKIELGERKGLSRDLFLIAIEILIA